MDIKTRPCPELQPIEEVAIDTVVSVVNRAKEQLGERQTLKDLARCRELFGGVPKLNITGLRSPLAITAEQFIDDTVRFHWRLTDFFMFALNYKGSSIDEISHYYYYEQSLRSTTAEQFIDDIIQWRLTDLFMFALNYKGSSIDEISHYYYYEAIFSQPTPKYPIPQATAKVFFRVQDRYTHPPTNAPAPVIQYRLEGQRTSHDIRHVTLIPDWLLAIVKMKITLFKRIEGYNIF